MKRLFTSAALLCAISALPGLAQTLKPVGAYAVPVTGTIGSGLFSLPVSGTFVVKTFANINNQLNAVGTLTIANTSTSVAIPVTASTSGTLSSASVVLTHSDQAITADAAAAAAPSCPVLNLVLGPLNLNVLGLVVNLNQVNLNITAVPGAGNLLGNLLCDVANLLNPGSLNNLVTILNQILASL